jgi:hypothetical protein
MTHPTEIKEGMVFALENLLSSHGRLFRRPHREERAPE